MKKSLLAISFLLLLGAVLAGVYVYKTHDDHDHAHSHDDGHDHGAGNHRHGGDRDHNHGHDHDEDGHAAEPVYLSDADAGAAGITTVAAAPRQLQRQLAVFGKVMSDPEKTWQITARFPGVVRSVNVRPGSIVKAGDVLATVEANDSLRTYAIAAPADGVILVRWTNPGETASDNRLFFLSDTQTLVVQLSVFPFDKRYIREGLTVKLHNRQTVVTSSIQTIVADMGATPMTFAQVPVDNTQDDWVMGETIRAVILLDAREVAVCVDNRALQTLEDGVAVFVKNGNLYEPRFVTLGDADDECTEVLSGLDAGEYYVSGNAYLLKADLEKSGAAHEH